MEVDHWGGSGGLGDYTDPYVRKKASLREKDPYHRRLYGRCPDSQCPVCADGWYDSEEEETRAYNDAYQRYLAQLSRDNAVAFQQDLLARFAHQKVAHERVKKVAKTASKMSWWARLWSWL